MRSFSVRVTRLLLSTTTTVFPWHCRSVYLEPSWFKASLANGNRHVFFNHVAQWVGESPQRHDDWNLIGSETSKGPDLERRTTGAQVETCPA